MRVQKKVNFFKFTEIVPYLVVCSHSPYLDTVPRSKLMVDAMDEEPCTCFQRAPYHQLLMHTPTYRSTTSATHPIANRGLNSGIREVCRRASISSAGAWLKHMGTARDTPFAGAALQMEME